MRIWRLRDENARIQPRLLSFGSRVVTGVDVYRPNCPPKVDTRAESSPSLLRTFERRRRVAFVRHSA